MKKLDKKFINLFLYKTKFKKTKDTVFFLSLLILGLFGANLFVEVSSRYFLPEMVPLLLIAAIIITINIDKIKKEKED